MINWEHKAIEFIHLTSKWEREQHIHLFLSYCISLLRRLTDADISVHMEYADGGMVRIVEATPACLQETLPDPVALKQLLYQYGFKTIYWPDIPLSPPAFGHLLEGLHAAVIIPFHQQDASSSLIVLGWHQPQLFNTAFLDCIEIVRLRLREILSQLQLQVALQKATVRFTAILHTIPHPLVFIHHDSRTGWVNMEGSRLLGLTAPGEQPSSLLHDAMAELHDLARHAADFPSEVLYPNPAAVNGQANWLWHFTEPVQKCYRVSCLPVLAQQINGRLWIFEEVMVC